MMASAGGGRVGLSALWKALHKADYAKPAIMESSRGGCGQEAVWTRLGSGRHPRKLNIISSVSWSSSSTSKTVMGHISSPPVTPCALPASAFSDHITAELYRYDEHLHDVRGLANGRLSKPDAKIQRYRALGSLIDFLQTL